MELLPLHDKQWRQFQQIIARQRLSQALLLVADSNCEIDRFIHRLMALRFCNKASTEPCMQCQHCRLIQADQHPDVHWIAPEKAGGALKIDQIRQLQIQAYKTPKIANSQFFVLKATERMNKSTANALLKVLEEPSAYTQFILIAEHLSTLLPTIISRCQQWHFVYPLEGNDLLALLNSYPEASGIGVISQNMPDILDNLIQLFTKESIPTLIAKKMAGYEFKELLWLLSLIYSQLIQLLMLKKQASGLHSQALNRLLAIAKVDLLFNQLAKITSLQRKMSHNLNSNQTLALEDLFIHLQQAIKQ